MYLSMLHKTVTPAGISSKKLTLRSSDEPCLKIRLLASRLLTWRLKVVMFTPNSFAMRCMDEPESRLTSRSILICVVDTCSPQHSSQHEAFSRLKRRKSICNLSLAGSIIFLLNIRIGISNSLVHNGIQIFSSHPTSF